MIWLELNVHIVEQSTLPIETNARIVEPAPKKSFSQKYRYNKEFLGAHSFFIFFKPRTKYISKILVVQKKFWNSVTVAAIRTIFARVTKCFPHASSDSPFLFSFKHFLVSLRLCSISSISRKLIPVVVLFHLQVAPTHYFLRKLLIVILLLYRV